MSKDMEEVISEGTRRSHRNGRLDLNGDGNRNRLCIISGKNILAEPERIQLKSVCLSGKPSPSFYKFSEYFIVVS